MDLSTCIEGDLLICRTGAVLKYLRPTDPRQPEGYFDHVIEYLFIPNIDYPVLNIGRGTRTNDGYVFRKNRSPKDHDVILIIKPIKQDNEITYSL